MKENARRKTTMLLASCQALREALLSTDVHTDRYLQVVRETEEVNLWDKAVRRYSEATNGLLTKIEAMILIVSMANDLWKLKDKALKAEVALRKLQEKVDLSGADLYGGSWPLVEKVQEFVSDKAADMTLALQAHSIVPEVSKFIKAFRSLNVRPQGLTAHFDRVKTRVLHAQTAKVQQAWAERRVVESLLETGAAAFRAVELFKLAQLSLPKPPAQGDQPAPVVPG